MSTKIGKHIYAFRESTFLDLQSAIADWQLKGETISSISCYGYDGFHHAIIITGPSETVLTSKDGYNTARINTDGAVLTTNFK